MTSISVIMTVFVLNLHYRGPSRYRVPPWVRRYILGTLARGLCMRQEPSILDDYYGGSGNTNYIKNLSLKLTIENLAQELKEEIENNERTTAETALNHERVTMIDPQVDYGNTQNQNDRRHNVAFTRFGSAKANEDILTALKQIIDRYERDDVDEQIMQEWRQVAQVVDKLLFWIFLTGTVISTSLVLIAAPVTRML